MKAASLSVIVLCLWVSAAPAQPRNNFQLTAGYPHLSPHSDIQTNIPLFAFQYEYKISRLGIAPFLAYSEFTGYQQASYLFYYVAEEVSGSLLLIGTKGNLYLVQNEKFDLYGGIMLGLLGVSDAYLDTEPVNETYRYGTLAVHPSKDSRGPIYGVQAGAHFWLRRHFGITAEIAYGTAFVNAGVIFRH